MAAFTLVEMLVTLALLLIMFVLLYGFGSHSHQQQMKQACQKNLLRAYVGLEIFAREHDGLFPVVPGAKTSEEPLALLVPRYTVDTASFICPGSKDAPVPEGESLAGRRISYAYFMGRRATETNEVLMSDRLIALRPKRQGEPVFSLTGKAPGNNHHKYGGNFLFADGRVESSFARAPFSLVWPESVVLLNPKP